MKSMRFIRVEWCGMSLLSTKPATKAPMMCSTPATSAKKAAKNTTDKTKIYWDVFSLSSLLKNHLAILGITKNMINENMRSDVSKRIQKLKSNCPLVALEMMASMMSTAVSVRIVPPTVMATAGCLVRPNLLTIGYATSVCVENILAVSNAASGERCKISVQSG